jgi:hypothetical protein
MVKACCGKLRQARNDTERKAGTGKVGRQGWVRYGALWKDEVGQARCVKVARSKLRKGE